MVATDRRNFDAPAFAALKKRLRSSPNSLTRQRLSNGNHHVIAGGMVDLLHRETTDAILDCFYRGGNKMGHGFLESVYQNVMFIELTERGMRVQAKPRLPVRYRGRIVGDFEPDLVVNDCVIVEIKAGRTIDTSAVAQVINYLKASGLEVGLILNFGPRLEFRRLAFDGSRPSVTSPAACDPPPRRASAADP